MMATVIAVMVTLAATPGPAQAGPGRSAPVVRVRADRAATSASAQDAMVFVPYSGAPAIVRLGDQQETFPVPAMAYPRPWSGRFDGSGGGGVFVYGGGKGKASGILRVRRVAGELQLSFRREVVNGIYDGAVVGDFDGNGIDDILWLPLSCCFEGTRSAYLWSFHADGSHSSRPIAGLDNSGFRWTEVDDVDRDGIDDIVWVDVGVVWLMHADGTHGRKVLPELRRQGTNQSPIDAAIGDLGPAESDHPSRLHVLCGDGYEALLTFDGSGNHTTTGLAAAGSVSDRGKRAFAGHFRTGESQSLFWYDSAAPKRREVIEDFDADGTPHEVAVHQISGSYYARVGDFDGNGFDDILWYDRQGRSSVWSSDGSDFTDGHPAGIPLSSRPLVVHLDAT